MFLATKVCVRIKCDIKPFWKTPAKLLQLKATCSTQTYEVPGNSDRSDTTREFTSETNYVRRRFYPCVSLWSYVLHLRIHKKIAWKDISDSRSKWSVFKQILYIPIVTKTLWVNHIYIYNFSNFHLFAHVSSIYLNWAGLHITTFLLHWSK